MKLCRKGLHDLDLPENAYFQPEGRRCGPCRREMIRVWHHNHPATPAQLARHRAWEAAHPDLVKLYQTRADRKRGYSEKDSPEHIAKRRVAEPTYAGIHDRARRHLPKVCNLCGSVEDLQVAYRWDTPEEFQRIEERPGGSSLLYSVRHEDYVRLCRKCHGAYDSRRSSGLPDLDR